MKLTFDATPKALAIVDAFLASRELPTDVRQKVLQSRDGLARAVAIRRAFAAGPAKAR